MALVKGIDFGFFKDEGARKLIAACTGIVCITVMTVAGVPEAMLDKMSQLVLYLVGIFTGGNLAEHLFKALKAVKPDGE